MKRKMDSLNNQSRKIDCKSLYSFGGKMDRINGGGKSKSSLVSEGET
uniref:Uncharacterized protein n=1 Tax=Lepeophtheirus salmonis TaxID=72036 RepID=A0A0K2V5T2_LEPSM